jgi:NAD(P)-dependent dehydrogenase (short-subunit alcohol dehydrogenase family)
MQLEAKRTIITGGASGIAAATVRAFAREGAAVVSLDVNDEDGERVAAEAASLGAGPVTYRHCDISKRDEVIAVFEEEVSRLGGLDVLANIAGIEQQVPGEDVTEEDLDLMFAVHVKGTVFTNQAAFRAMQDAGGSIINYSSYAGVRGFPQMPAYGAAKAAILGWTRIVAQDWGPKWIRVNAVCPAVLTPLAEQWFNEMSPERLAMVEEQLARQIPLGGKLGTVDDAANLNVFLGSDRARFMTGQTIPVDGGQMMVS